MLLAAQAGRRGLPYRFSADLGLGIIGDYKEG
jgi:hypothetical protein